MPFHSALLIGINFYKDHPLKGAVEDVSLIQRFLHFSPKPIDITYLTATSPSDAGSSNPAEDPASWPTYKNVTAALRRIADTAIPGDCVYLHFSGHGTRTLNDGRGNAGGDLALVLYDSVYGTRYLRGVELGFFLRKLVDKGLLVTVVLDCCFSGSVLRHGDEDVLVRAVDYDPVIDTAFPVEGDTVYDHLNGLFRNAEINDWLIDPKGYAILSACGPHEKAFELRAAGVSHGALSYFLLSALTSLRKRGAIITQQSLHQHLSLKFHVDWPRQRPMRYGNQNFSFFDGLIPDPDLSFVPVLARDDSQILGAGYAHGVQTGDEYSLFSLAESETITTMPKKALGKGKAVKVRGMTSVLTEIGSSSLVILGRVQLKAKLLTRLSPWKASVGVQFQMDGLAKWMGVANQKPIMQLSSRKENDTGDLFSIVRNEQNLEIRDGLIQKLPAVPTVPLKSEGALNRVLHILEHLGTFKYFEGIQNRMPNSTFEQSFISSVNPESGRNGQVKVKDEGIVSLTVENLSKKPLYMAVFDMGPSWQIDNLLSQSGAGDYKVILPKSAGCNGVEKISLRMCIPESLKSQGHTECEDIIKVFVTNMASSFPALELPDLVTSLARLDEHHRSPYDHIARFLDGLATRFRSSEDTMVDEKWAAWNIIVNTFAARKPCHTK